MPDLPGLPSMSYALLLREQCAKAGVKWAKAMRAEARRRKRQLARKKKRRKERANA